MPFITQGKINLKYILIVVIIIILIIVIGNWLLSYVLNVPTSYPSKLLICFLSGKSVEPTMGSFTCVSHYSDGDKPCTGSGQCQGNCISLSEPYTKGFCQNKSNEFPCGSKVLKDGKILPVPCP